MTPMTPMDTMSTAANRFFDVPELVCLLTEHMGPKEHRALTLTSCFLRTIFEPIIYHSLDMTYRSGRAYLLESPHAQQALARNVSSVRSPKLGRVDTACLYNCFLAHQRTIRTHGTVSPDSARLPPWLPRRNNTEFREVPLAPMFNLTKLEIDFTRTDDDNDWRFLDYNHRNFMSTFAQFRVQGIREVWFLAGIIARMSGLEGMNLDPILEATADSPEWFEVWSTVLYGSPCSLKRFSLDVGFAPFTSKVPGATAGKDTGNVIFGGTGMRVESPRSQEVLLALLELVWPFDQGGLLTSNGIMRVLKYVPNLTKLAFRNLGAHIDDDVLAPIIARCCPTLTRLEFTSALSIRTNFLLFKLMLALEKEQVEEINISHMAWVRKEMDLSILKSALQRHSWSLKVINIYQCDIVFSYVVETALSECLGLEELRLSCGGLQPSYITLEEAVEVTPWTCSRLQILDLTIEGAGLGRTLDEGAWTKLSDTEEVFAMFKRLYEQIGTLKELRCLDLRGFVESRTKHPHNYDATLPAMLSLGDQSSGRPGFLSLLGGLNKLEELRRSVYVSSEEGKATMGWPEARWMQEHWPNPRIAEFFFNDEEPTEPFKWLKDRRRTSPLELSVIDSPFRVRPRADIGAL